MALKVGELFASFNLDSSGVDSDVKDIESKLGGIGDIGQDLQDAGDSLSGITDAVIGWGKELYESGAGFNEQMGKVAALREIDLSTEDGQAQMAALTESALDMAAKTKFTTTEAAKAMTYMAMAGWDTQEIMSGLPGVMYLTAASGEDLAATSDIVTDAMTAFGMKADQAGHFSDVLARVTTNSNTNVGLLGETFKYCAGLAGAMGYSLEDTSVAVGLMANRGIKGSQAGTALKNILTRMAKPTDEVAEAMELMGIRLDDGNGNMLSFRDVMKQMRTGFGGLKISADELIASQTELDEQLASGKITEEEYNTQVGKLMERAYGAEGALKAQAAATLAGKYGLAGLLAIVGATDEEFDAMCAAVDDADGAAERMGQTMLDNAAGDVAKLLSAINVLQTSLWQLVDGPFREVVQSLTGVVTGFNNMDEGTKEGIIKMGMLAAAIGPVLSGAGGLVTALPMLIHGLAALVTPLGLITIGLVALGAAMMDSEGNIGKAFNELLGTGAEKLAELGVTVENMDLGDRMDGFLESIRTGAEKFLPKIFGSIVKIMVTLMSDLASEMPAIADTAGALFKTLVEGIIDALPSLLSGFAGLMTSVWEAILGTGEEPGMLTDIADFAVKMAQDLVDMVSRGFEGMEANDTTLVDAAAGLIQGLVNALPHLVDAAGNIISAGAMIAAKIMESIATGLAKADENGLGTQIGQVAVDLVKKILGFITDFSSNESVQSFMQNLGAGLASCASMIGDIAGEIIKYLLSQEGLEALWNAGVALGTALLKGIGHGLSALTGIVFSLVDSVLESLGIIDKDAADAYRSGEKLGESLADTYREGVEAGVQSKDYDTFSSAVIASLFGSGFGYDMYGTDAWNYLQGYFGDLYDGFDLSAVTNDLWNQLTEMGTAEGGVSGAQVKKMFMEAYGPILDDIDWESIPDDMYDMMAAHLSGKGGAEGRNNLLAMLVAMLGLGGAADGAGAAADAESQMEKDLAEITETYVQTAEEAGATITEAMDGAASEAGAGGFATAVAENGAEAQAAALTVSDSVVQAFLMTLSAENGALIGTQFTGGITQAITEGGAGISGAATAAGNAAKAAAGAAASAAAGVEIGRNFGLGFVNGIRSMIGAAASAAASLGSAAAAGLGGSLKIGSPSKLTHETGLNFDRGFILGIEGLMDDAANTARQLGSGAARSLEYAASDMGRMAADGMSVPVTGRGPAVLSRVGASDGVSDEAIDRYTQRIVDAMEKISIVMDSTDVGHLVSGTVSADIAHGSAQRR